MKWFDVPFELFDAPSKLFSGEVSASNVHSRTLANAMGKASCRSRVLVTGGPAESTIVF